MALGFYVLPTFRTALILSCVFPISSTTRTNLVYRYYKAQCLGRPGTVVTIFVFIAISHKIIIVIAIVFFVKQLMDNVDG